MDNFEKMAGAMPKTAKFLSKLRHHFTRGLSSLPKEEARALRRKTMRTSGGVPDSFFMWPATALASKIKGKHSVQKALWNKLHKPALSADIAAGNVAHDVFKHVPGMRKLFLQKEMIPVTRHGVDKRTVMDKLKGKSLPVEKLHKEIERPSITAPLSKATEVVTPFAVGMAGEKLIHDLKKKKEDAKKHPTSVE